MQAGPNTSNTSQRYVPSRSAWPGLLQRNVYILTCNGKCISRAFIYLFFYLRLNPTSLLNLWPYAYNFDFFFCTPLGGAGWLYVCLKIPHWVRAPSTWSGSCRYVFCSIFTRWLVAFNFFLLLCIDVCSCFVLRVSCYYMFRVSCSACLFLCLIFFLYSWMVRLASVRASCPRNTWRHGDAVLFICATKSTIGNGVQCLDVTIRSFFSIVTV